MGCLFQLGTKQPMNCDASWLIHATFDVFFSGFWC